jgi:hypothetical protein
MGRECQEKELPEDRIIYLGWRWKERCRGVMKLITFLFIGLMLYLPCFAQGYSDNSAKQTEKQVYVPKNLDECYAEITKNLLKPEIEEYKNTREDIAVARAHMGLGMWIRNNWGLRTKDSDLARYFRGMGVFHPDDMSGIILTSFHRYLNNRPIELNKQVKYYKDYWENIKKDKLK